MQETFQQFKWIPPSVSPTKPPKGCLVAVGNPHPLLADTATWDGVLQARTSMESMLPELDSDVVGKVLWANGILTDFNLPMGQQVRRALPVDRMSRYAKWDFVSWCDSLVAKGMDREAPWLL